MKYCANCNVKTNSTYHDHSIGFLCGKCVKEHGELKIEQLNKEKDKINKQIQDIKEKITIAIQSDCKHENSINTNYVFIGQDEFEQSWRCPDCGLIFKRTIK